MLIRYFLPTVVVLVLIISWTATLENKTSFSEKKEMIVMRQVGHTILLQAGDSTSRVLPVRQVSANEYRLSFETAFHFIPDSLVNLVKRIIQKNGLPKEYVVNMLSCSNKEVIYGFAMTGNKSDEIVPCLGRRQAKGCYILQVIFPVPPAVNTTSYLFWTISVLLFVSLATAAFILKRRKEKNGATAVAENEATDKDQSIKPGIRIGLFHFDAAAQLLHIDNTSLLLTSKESKLLQILASSLNEVVDRSLLLKQVWEDEGVITGRSLDMFISKLRKKLQQDESVSIKNIHGKGYKLQVMDTVS